MSGDAIVHATSPGLHGFPPDRETMNSSLIVNGPGVRAGRIEGVQLLGIGPTVAEWLGLRLEKAEGKALLALWEASSTPPRK
ncbi:MAG TPA: hypothetical protein VKG84_04700 [Candidatus Acidoferrales bacterium]|nr:hypothetical protein [Candidatus Acidoferrales bacterium]